MTADGFTDKDGGEEIAVRPEHREAKVLWRIVGLAIWMGGLLSFMGQRAASNIHGTTIPLSVFLVLWVGVGVIVAIDLLWILFGAQVVCIRGGDLTIEHRIGSTALRKSKAFPVAHIGDKRMEKRSSTFKGKTMVRFAITFDYLGQRRDLFVHLSEHSAESLLKGPLDRFSQRRP